MSTDLLLICLLLLPISAVSFGVFIVKRLLKKTTWAGKLSLCALAAAVICFSVSLGADDPSACLVLLGMLLLASSAVILAVGIVRKCMKKTARKVFLSYGAVLVLGIALIFLSSFSWRSSLNDPEKYEVVIKTDYDFEVRDGAEPLEVITKSGFTSSGVSRYQKVFDICDIPLLFDKTDASAADCLRLIGESDRLSEKYKTYFSDFVNRIDAAYPDADLSILYHNLSTLKVIELDRMDYFSKSLSVDSYGCYRIDENIIYIPKGTEYTEGEWGFQVLIHEFCHAVRTARFEDKEKGAICQAEFNGLGSDKQLLMEAMNSVFSCSLLRYEEKDIAYQVPSNYLRIMLECMDNYSLTDYINHGDTYFLRKLDEYTGHTNYAEVMWKLIAVQRSDYQDSRMELSPDKYYPIYRYLCDMYFDKYITDGMTAGQEKEIVDELIGKAFYDAPEEYTISPDYFYTCLEEYKNK